MVSVCPIDLISRVYRMHQLAYRTDALIKQKQQNKNQVIMNIIGKEENSPANSKILVNFLVTA